MMISGVMWFKHPDFPVRLMAYRLSKLKKAVDTVTPGQGQCVCILSYPCSSVTDTSLECSSLKNRKDHVEQKTGDHEPYLASYRLAAMRLPELWDSSSSKTEETKAVPAKRHLSDPICSHSRILEINSHAAGPVAGHSAFSPCHPNLIRTTEAPHIVSFFQHRLNCSPGNTEWSSALAQIPLFYDCPSFSHYQSLL